MTARNTFGGIAGERLAALEDRARAGESVKATDFAAATAAARLEVLAAEGVAARAEETAQQAEAERRDGAVESLKSGLISTIAHIQAMLSDAVAVAADESADQLLSASRLEFPASDAMTAAHKLIESLDGPHEQDRARYVSHCLALSVEEASVNWASLVDVPALREAAGKVQELCEAL